MSLTDSACRKGTLLRCPGTIPSSRGASSQGPNEVCKGLLGSITYSILMNVSVSIHIPCKTHTACTCMCPPRALRRLVLWARMPHSLGRRCLRLLRGRMLACAKPSARHALQATRIVCNLLSC